MRIIEWAEARSQAMSVWDTGVLKTYCVLFGMILGAYTSSFVIGHVGWFVAGVLVTGGYYGYRFLTAPSARH